ncbi:MAG: hypothetical protein JWQ23_871 [Herminiimonas sp.]|nr:hypothetical protein [Herminiimonas sp.]
MKTPHCVNKDRPPRSLDLKIFFGVGDDEQRTTAICLRYGIPGCYKLMVVDGGTEQGAHALIAHLGEHYSTNAVDHVVCSHPDAHRAAGLSVMLRTLQVGTLWMHRPWLHSVLLRAYFEGNTDTGLAASLTRQMHAAYSLEQLALERGVRIHEPFSGDEIGEFHILSPNRDWYISSVLGSLDRSAAQRQAAQLILTAFYQRPWLSQLNNADHDLSGHRAFPRDQIISFQLLKNKAATAYRSGCLLIAATF